jgi:ABC-2 type transport system permease protein
MRKLLAIIWKENYVRFSDRAGAIYMFAAPLVLSTVIGLAFSGISGSASDVPELNIPVGIVNLDEGTAQFDFGEIYIQAMVPEDPANADETNPLFELLDAREIATVEEAHAMVESGELTASLTIPADFSQTIAIDPAAFSGGSGSETLEVPGVTLELYYNSSSQIGWGVFRDIVQDISNSIATTNIAISTMINGVGLPGLLSISQVQEQAGAPDANPIHIQEMTIEGEEVETDLFRFFAPGIAIFFTGFTVMLGSISVLQEQHDWTLQRMVSTPTPRSTILAGKMLGTLTGGVLQLATLIISITVIASLLKGELANVWGDDILGIVLLTIAISAAGTGVGAILAGFARTFEQAANLGSVVMIIMGLMAGTFFQIDGLPGFLQMLSRLTFHYWGKDGYEQLSQGSTVVDIMPEIGALLLMAVVTFGIGIWLFRRRLDI